MVSPDRYQSKFYLLYLLAINTLLFHILQLNILPIIRLKGQKFFIIFLKIILKKVNKNSYKFI